MWFERAYGPQLASRQVQQANLSPNFPVAAEVWLRMYERFNHKSLDGVIAMDPVALRSFMRGTGAIRLSRSGTELTSETVVNELLRDSYLDFPTEDSQNRYLTEVVRAFWSKLRGGDLESPVAFVDGIGEAVRGQDLKIYSRDPEEQSALREMGADGDFSALGRNPQMLFNNNYATNKVDYFLHREIESRVRLLTTGAAEVRTDIVLTNSAPPGPESNLLGPGSQPDDPPGLNRMVLGLVLPKGATPHSFKVSGKQSGRPSVYQDSGFPVVWDLIEIPAGKTARVTLTYSVEDAFELSDAGGDFNMTLVPQARVLPDDFGIEVIPPAGFDVVTGNASDRFVASGKLTGAEVVRVELQPGE